jgi:hypothetical protein
MWSYLPQHMAKNNLFSFVLLIPKTVMFNFSYLTRRLLNTESCWIKGHLKDVPLLPLCSTAIAENICYFILVNLFLDMLLSATVM